jgi:transcriptional regulator with XRE-family HTH domain
MENFGQRLKDLRTEKNLSMKQLGNIIGVSDMAIHRWENNKADVLSESVIKLAKFFGVTTDYLLGLED